MTLGRRYEVLLGLALALVPVAADAQTPASLNLNWDHCAGDGRVADRSFACDTNTGSETLVGSVVMNDGIVRTGILGFQAFVDFASITNTVPPWWQVNTGQCRASAIAVDFGPFAPGNYCATWWGPDIPYPPVGIRQFNYGRDGPGTIALELGAAYGIDTPVTLPPDQEGIVFQIRVSHSKSTGTGACGGCDVPMCVGFGWFEWQRASPAPRESFLGSGANSATWQGAYVASYAPVPGHTDGGFWYPYHGNLQCTTAPVPAQGRTWGMIKTMYR